MIRINQLKLNIQNNNIQDAIIKLIGINRIKEFKNIKLQDYKILKKSIDARDKNDIKYIYCIDVELNCNKKTEEKLINILKNKNITISRDSNYNFKLLNTKNKVRPIIIGSGPAGLFCAYMFAKNGVSPLVIERGEQVEKRIEKVNNFWKNGTLDIETNVQFGEGGAGTFSDGKLNTLVKDKFGRNKLVLDTFVKYGASDDILYLNKPHIGTDKLVDVVKNMRNDIINMGGEFRFNTKLTNFNCENGKLSSIVVNDSEILNCNLLVLAIGHSSRDTFELLNKKGVYMEKKAFAIGVRIEHSQQFINNVMYGKFSDILPAADYKLTHTTKSGRGVYSFCMCPGGFVVNASSENKRLAINGMSNYRRNEENANSALIVTIKPEDFENNDVLAGVSFQRKWEEKAFLCGNGKIPIQLLGDLKNNQISKGFGYITPNIKGKYTFGDLRKCLPKYVVESILEGIEEFDKKIHGYANEEAILSGVETRTSSPVKILRNEFGECNIKGIYPCGEGAGYAGGIMSAAMDGIKIFEMIASQKFN